MKAEEKKKDTLAKIVITQFICAILILAIVITTKYFFKSTFKSVKKWYQREIENDTNIYEVIGVIDEI